MGRSYSSKRKPLTNLTSAQMWPFVWRQCLRTTPRAPDRHKRAACMSSEVDAHLAFGVLVRRAASALARCCCVGVAILLASAAATSAALSADSAWALLCFRPCYGSASGVGCAALQKSSVAVDRQARDGCKQRSAELSALVFASVVCAKSRPSETGPTRHARLWRTLGPRIRGLSARQKILECYL